MGSPGAVLAWLGQGPLGRCLEWGCRIGARVSQDRRGWGELQAVGSLKSGEVGPQGFRVRPLCCWGEAEGLDGQ